MIHLRETIEVPRPIDEVFAYTSNFGNAAQWDPGVAASRKESRGPIGVGTAFRLRVRFGPRSIPMTYVVREYDAPRRVRLEGKSDSVHALDDIAFASTPRGTRIDYTAAILPGMLGFTNVGYHWHKRSWKPLAVSLRGRSVVVTGATPAYGGAGRGYHHVACGSGGSGQGQRQVLARP